MIWECHTLTTNPGDTFPLQGSTRLGIKLRGGEPRLRTFPLEDKLYFTLFQKLGPFNPGLEREFQNGGGGNASHRLPPRGCPKPQGRMNWDRLSIPCYFFFCISPAGVHTCSQEARNLNGTESCTESLPLNSHVPRMRAVN